MSERLSGPVRARDLRANVKELGFEQGVMTTLELLLDEYSTHRQHMRELTQLVDKCIDQLGVLLSAAHGLKLQLQELKRTKEQGDEFDGE